MEITTHILKNADHIQENYETFCNSKDRPMVHGGINSANCEPCKALWLASPEALEYLPCKTCLSYHRVGDDAACRALRKPPSIEVLKDALQKMHHKACGISNEPYMSVPADWTRDADLLLSEALDELKRWRLGITIRYHRESACRHLPLSLKSQ